MRQLLSKGISVKVKFITRFFLFFATFLLSYNAFAFDSGALGVVSLNELPREAQETIVLIRQGGPFPYDKDGSIFGNYEKVLPQQKRGYYREYTVKTVSYTHLTLPTICSG